MVFMLTMLLFIALIIAGPEVLFCQTVLAYLPHIMLGLFALEHQHVYRLWKAHAHEFCKLVAVLCVFIKIKKQWRNSFIPKTITPKKFRFATSTQQCVWRPGYDWAAKTDVDLISFQELTPEWASILQTALAANYPPLPVGKNWSPWQSILFTLSHSHHRD